MDLKVNSKLASCARVVFMVGPMDPKVSAKTGLADVFGFWHWSKVCLTGTKSAAGGGVVTSMCPFCFKHGTNESTVMTHI